MSETGLVARLEDVGFRYEGRDAASLRDLCCAVRPGEFVVLTGPSGCGKTTLVRCLNGLIPHFFPGELTGADELFGRDARQTAPWEVGRRCASIFQDPRSQFFTTNSSCEAAFACENYGVPHDEIVRRVDAAFAAGGLEGLANRSVFDLSSGERQKVAFAGAWAMQPDLYVLDEPSANLDLASIERMRAILARLKAAGKTVVVSEHRLSYLAHLADRVLYLRDGRLAEEFSGAELRSLAPGELRRRGLRELDLGRVRLGTGERPATGRGMGLAAGPGLVTEHGPETAAGPGPAARRAAARPAATTFRPRAHPAPEPAVPLFEAAGIAFAPPRSQPIIRDLALTLRRGEVVALVGRNGCGKTTLGKIIAGLVPCRRGRFLVDGRRTRRRWLSDAAYFVMQEADFQLYTDSVRAELLLGREGDAERVARADKALELLGLAPVRDDHPQSLSGGQKQRVTVAAALVSQKPLVILDEPTSGLDWASMAACARAVGALRDAGRCALVITHDLEFIARAADRVLFMEDGAISRAVALETDADLDVVRAFMAGLACDEGGGRGSTETGAESGAAEPAPAPVRGSRGPVLDPRVKLLNALMVSTLAFSLPGRLASLPLLAAGALFALAVGRPGLAARFTVAWGALFALAQVVPLVLASIIYFLFLRAVVVVLAVGTMYATTEMAALVTALRAMRLPRELVVAVAVMLRFIPSFQQDVQSIAQGMRTRAVGVTPLRLVRHPALVYEGFVVPLLMRALMTSSELAASAETRGISCPCPKTSYLVVAFTIRDLVACLALVAMYGIIVGVLASGAMASL